MAQRMGTGGREVTANASADVKKRQPDSTSSHSADFFLYSFKILPCSAEYAHNWSACPYAHPQEKARRRDPRIYSYEPLPCPDDKKGTYCPRGESCNFTHNVYEYWLHPKRFRTQLCQLGASCNRPLCFFAHSVDELRKADSTGLAGQGTGTATDLHQQQGLDPYMQQQPGTAAVGDYAAAASSSYLPPVPLQPPPPQHWRLQQEQELTAGEGVLQFPQGLLPAGFTEQQQQQLRLVMQQQQQPLPQMQQQQPLPQMQQLLRSLPPLPQQHQLQGYVPFATVDAEAPQRYVIVPPQQPQQQLLGQQVQLPQGGAMFSVHTQRPPILAAGGVSSSGSGNFQPQGVVSSSAFSTAGQYIAIGRPQAQQSLGQVESVDLTPYAATASALPTLPVQHPAPAQAVMDIRPPSAQSFGSYITGHVLDAGINLSGPVSDVAFSSSGSFAQQPLAQQQPAQMVQVVMPGQGELAVAGAGPTAANVAGGTLPAIQQQQQLMWSGELLEQQESGGQMMACAGSTYGQPGVTSGAAGSNSGWLLTPGTAQSSVSSVIMSVGALSLGAGPGVAGGSLSNSMSNVDPTRSAGLWLGGLDAVQLSNVQQQQQHQQQQQQQQRCIGSYQYLHDL